MMTGCGDILKEWAPSNKEAMTNTSNIFAVFLPPEESVRVNVSYRFYEVTARKRQVFS